MCGYTHIYTIYIYIQIISAQTFRNGLREAQLHARRPYQGLHLTPGGTHLFLPLPVLADLNVAWSNNNLCLHGMLCLLVFPFRANSAKC